MRKVIYYCGGDVADFPIPDGRFEDFIKHLKWEARHSEDDLTKARFVLEAVVKQGAPASTPPEALAAACFVWNYFNTHEEDEYYIKGDIIIIDLNGDGATIEYASVNDIELAPAN